MSFSTKLLHLDMMSEIFFLDHFLRVFFPRVEFVSPSYNAFWRTRTLWASATYPVAATLPRPLPAFVFADDLDMAVGAYALLISLCCDKDNPSKRLEVFLFHNHFNITPTRRVLCLTLHPHSRDLPAQHSQHPRTRLRQENGQAPQMVMLVITRKNTNRRLPHPLYEHFRA